MSKENPLTKASVIKMMSKRVLVPATAVAKRVKLLITSVGKTIDVTDKAGNPVPSQRDKDVVLQKTLFNTNGASEVGMRSERNKEYFTNGRKAEKLGGTVHGEIKGEEGDFTADDWYSAYLNATQVSFGVLLPNSDIANGFLVKGVEIAATVVRIDTDNGSILSIDPSTLSVQAPETLHAAAFSEDDFADEDDEPIETPAELKARLAAEKKLAAKK